MRFTNVKVKRDTNTVYNRSVPEWEVPVLEFIFENGNVERLGTFGEVARDYPAPAVEFDRLVRSYGADPQSGIPYVASVYGQASAGVRALGRAIEEAKADDAKAAPKHLIEADPLTA